MIVGLGSDMIEATYKTTIWDTDDVLFCRFFRDLEEDEVCEHMRIAVAILGKDATVEDFEKQANVFSLHKLCEVYDGVHGFDEDYKEMHYGDELVFLKFSDTLRETYEGVFKMVYFLASEGYRFKSKGLL